MTRKEREKLARKETQLFVASQGTPVPNDPSKVPSYIKKYHKKLKSMTEAS